MEILNKKVVAAAIFLCSILALTAYHPQKPAPAAALATENASTPDGALQSEKTIDDAAETAHWHDRIAAVGGIAAYKEFGVEAAKYDFGARHVLAHLFGKALYTVEGLSGVSACDSNYSYGCFHQFLGEAIGEHGFAAAATLNTTCEQQASQFKQITCQHGIGHGVLAYSGYTQDDLLKALDACHSFSGADLGGCYSGAFMEYNVRLMISPDLGVRDYAEMRPLPKDGDFEAPCDAVSDAYRPSCVLLLPQWWDTALLHDDHSAQGFADMGDKCHTVAKHIGMGDLCFQGIGLVTGTDPQLAMSLCDATSKNTQEQLQCRSFSAHFITSELGVSEGIKVCAGLTGKDKTYCESYAHNETTLFGADTAELLQ